VTSRRTFLVALGSGLLGGPGVSLAQSRPARIGFLYVGSRQSALDTGRLGAFVQGMTELHYVEGTSFIIEGRFGDGKVERLGALAAELVRLKVDVIVATGTPSLRALQHSTTTIPVVSTVTADPIGDGFAATLARPSGNITGLTLSAGDLGPKQLELLRTAMPQLARVAVLTRSQNPAHPRQVVRIMSVAQKVGMQVMLAEADTLDEIEREFATLTKARVGAVIVLADTLFVQESRAIVTQATRYRMPLIGGNPEFCEAGGLMSYGANLNDNFRRAATYVDKILKGARPSDLPFEQPTRYSLLINRKSATALGLTLPQALLIQADEVIQ
jgi:putative tryptophan/tyrosine transport system substrate-binding protein